MALDTWNNAGDEPGRLTHLDDRNDRAVLVQGSGGPAQIVELLCHEGAPSLPATMVTWRHGRPHSISMPPRHGASLSPPSTDPNRPPYSGLGHWRPRTPASSSAA